MAAISSGSGRFAVMSSVPKSSFSKVANLAGSAFVESIVMDAVGFLPVTATGVVLTDQDKVIASGESLIVVYAFSEGAARQS